MAAMFGYNARPTALSLAAYFGYWAIVLFDVGVKWARGTLTDATKGKRKYSGGVEAGAAGDPSTAPHLLEPAHPTAACLHPAAAASEPPSVKRAPSAIKKAADVENGGK